jgi:hypothetical protein
LLAGEAVGLAGDVVGKAEGHGDVG